MKLLCAIRLHRWSRLRWNAPIGPNYRVCLRCNRREGFFLGWLEWKHNEIEDGERS